MNHKEILARYSVRAKKSLGQNFLTSLDSLEAIASATKVEGENIIEVGPGYGALTERLLASNPKSLTLVELDKDMIAILEDRLQIGDLVVPKGVDFTIKNQDVLKFSPDFTEGYSVIANIPYYITSPILYRFLYELPGRPKSMVILMQKEVADRIRAKDGKESYLSLFCKHASASIEEIVWVPASCFTPAPKVDSAVLLFQCDNQTTPKNTKRFLEVARAGFSAPRKKLASNLSGGLGISKEKVVEVLSSLGLREDIRGEAISIEDWEKIAEML